MSTICRGVHYLKCPLAKVSLYIPPNFFYFILHSIAVHCYLMHRAWVIWTCTQCTCICIIWPWFLLHLYIQDMSDYTSSPPTPHFCSCPPSYTPPSKPRTLLPAPLPVKQVFKVSYNCACACSAHVYNFGSSYIHIYRTWAIAPSHHQHLVLVHVLHPIHPRQSLELSCLLWIKCSK